MYARIDTSRDLTLCNDAELVRLLKRGHDEALEELLRRHREALYRFCCHLMTTREDAEDICQETLARAITRVDSLQTGSAFRSWLFSIARNLSVDSYRTKKRTCPMPDDEAIPLPLYTETPQDQIEIHEEHQTVAEALGKLTDSHQRVLMLREVNGLSYAAIAEEMQVTQSAVETLLFRARRRLREEYSKSAVPMIALLNDLRDLAMRFAAPVASGTAVTKFVVASALVGGGLATTAHSLPASPQALHALNQRPVIAQGLHRVAAAPVQHHVDPVVVRHPVVTHWAPVVHAVTMPQRPVEHVIHTRPSHPATHVPAVHAVSSHAPVQRAQPASPPAPPQLVAVRQPDPSTRGIDSPPAPPPTPSPEPFLAVTSTAPASSSSTTSSATTVTKASVAASTVKTVVPTPVPGASTSSPGTVTKGSVALVPTPAPVEPTPEGPTVTKSEVQTPVSEPTSVPTPEPTPATQTYGKP